MELLVEFNICSLCGEFTRQDFPLILVLLTAGDSKRTFLTVEGIELEIHGAGESEGDSGK